MFRTRFVLWATWTFSSLLAVAQPQTFRFGDVGPADFAPTVYLNDSSAHAVVLCHNGKITAEFRELAGGFAADGGNYEAQVRTKHHVRIRILTEAGKDYGVVRLQYDRNAGENVTIENAVVHNLRDGKVESVRLGKADYLTVDVDGEQAQKRIVFPNVVPGSIIEYEFVRSSKTAWAVAPWYFQREIPVLYSELRLQSEIPYKILLYGQQVMQFESARSNHWYLRDLPALPEGTVWAPATSDYAEHIRLQYAKSFGQAEDFKSVAQDWQRVARDLLLRDAFAEYTDRNADQFRGLLSRAGVSPADVPLQVEVARRCQRYVARNFRTQGWGLADVQPLQRILQTNTTTDGGKNLMLLGMLRAAGIAAHPVLIRRQSSGRIRKEFALVSQFDHTLVAARLDGRDWLLDATNPNLPIEYLPQYCLNAEGWLLDPRDARFVPIPNPPSTRRYDQLDLRLQADGSADLHLRTEANGYYAEHIRRQRRDDADRPPKVVPALADEQFAVRSTRYEHLDDLDSNLRLETRAAAAAGWFNPQAGDLYFDASKFLPILLRLPDERRLLPVLIPNAATQVISLQVQPPPGYRLASLPKTATIRTPNSLLLVQMIVSAGPGHSVQYRITCSQQPGSMPARDYELLLGVQQQLHARLRELVHWTKQ